MTEHELLQRYAEGERDFQGANLQGAFLIDADLRDANLQGADLSFAFLMDADLRDATLSGANLKNAALHGTNLRCITLCGATIDGAILNHDAVGGPGHILCALTDAEWAWVKQQREEVDDE